jgi:DNA mismatch repair protein MutL
MPIRKLPALLVNQIAAGEVIERPASVVKELIENSLDAGATRLDIAVEDGGRRLVRVSDDGAGIESAQLPLAVAPHATSKLTAAEDLETVGTLGFRGEAMASIASVSRMRLTSQAMVGDRRQEEGWSIEVSGASVGVPTPCSCAGGTIVEVKDLFFNTPARRKFLRTAGTEMGHIADAVTRIAMVWPQVSFTLSHQGRKIIDLNGPHTRRQRCLELLGADLADALLELNCRQESMSVWAMVGLPEVARATARFTYLSINERPVRDRNIAHALREAFRGLMPPDRHPVAALALQIDAQHVDVNVHPTKAEVRFGQPSLVHGMVLNAVRRRLLEADLTPIVRPQNATTAHVPGAPGPVYSAPPPLTGVSMPGTFVREPIGPTGQGGFDIGDVRQRLEASVGPAPAAPDTQTGEPPLATPVLTRNVLQVHKTYLVTEDEQGMLIIDQHALHERVMFEQLRSRVARGDLESQRLLVPEVLETDQRRMGLIDGLAAMFKRLGIEVAPMGPSALAIHAFPTFLFERKVAPAPFVQELLDLTEDGSLQVDQEEDENVLHKVLDMMACKAAIKAGDQMSPNELAELLAQREQVERSSACPHGRPTAIRMTLRDLERHFKRS